MGVRADAIRVYRDLRRFGYNDSHSGNLSVRKGSRFWVTPTGACADTLRKSELVGCDVDGALGAGASLDANLHQAVYRSDPAVGAVVHSHCPYAVAMTFDGEDYLPPDFEGQYYLPRVSVLTIAYQSYVAEAPQRVADVLARATMAIVRGHGVYARGRDLDEAYKWTCSVELSAKTAWLARQAGKLNPSPR
jgi:L-fuculose-phosphate aldolase